MLEFAETDENFAEAFLLAKQAQENWLVLGAIKKKIDTTMAIFALKNVAGWRDKTEVNQPNGDVRITNIVNSFNIDDSPAVDAALTILEDNMRIKRS